MFTFDGKFKVLKLEDKSIAKRDGGQFTFQEATIESLDKKKTKFVARISDYDEPINLVKDGEYNLTLQVGSFEGKDGRIFVNLVIIGINATLKEVTQVQDLVNDDEIPFSEPF